MSVKQFFEDLEGFRKFFFGEKDTGARTRKFPFVVAFVVIAGLASTGKLPPNVIFYGGIGLFVWIIYSALFGEKSVLKAPPAHGAKAGSGGETAPSTNSSSFSTSKVSTHSPKAPVNTPSTAKPQSKDAMKNALNKALARRDGKNGEIAESKSATEASHNRQGPKTPMINRR